MILKLIAPMIGAVYGFESPVDFNDSQTPIWHQ